MWIKNFRFDRPLTSYDAVHRLIGAATRNRRWQVGNHRIRNLRYLNLGSGCYVRGDFINLEYTWQPGIDVCWDIRRPLPFRNGSLQGVFTEHVLEHFTQDMGEKILAECCRILAPGGRIRVIVPDAEVYMTRYADRVRRISDALLPYETENRRTPTPIIVVNRVYSHGHQCMYDFALMRATLLRTGFSNPVKLSYRRGADPKLLIDLESRQVESLYVEAVKK
jgi:predicted SAM-dependent methyltransferase